MNRAIGLCDGGAPCLELDDYCQHSMLEGMTYKAVDAEGNIAGVIISGDCPLVSRCDELWVRTKRFLERYRLPVTITQRTY